MVFLERHPEFLLDIKEVTYRYESACKASEANMINLRCCHDIVNALPTNTYVIFTDSPRLPASTVTPMTIITVALQLWKSTLYMSYHRVPLAVGAEYIKHGATRVVMGSSRWFLIVTTDNTFDVYMKTTFNRLLKSWTKYWHRRDRLL
ncbi:hypothetical protein H4R35_003642 [Dimargaris xerosporica]|nr:hypothetical protein H4R35_003642 [Dimargaris xerosporica]